ncbi:MAG: heavy-metal-associated domain-containing protein [Burkholderiales bacterium]|jgi:copper chaperone CopZ|nr:MAG: heavy-metal-associated domain-containing protein [Burkholderiales bacterium]
MAQQFEISGMHCGGCVNRVAKALRAIDAGVAVTLEPPRAQFSEAAQVSLDEVNALLAGIGEYRASEVA